MRIESGPAKKDALWQLARAAVFLGVALYFVYDGAYGWPQKNKKEAKNALAAPEPFDGKIKYEDLGPTPTKPQFEALTEQAPCDRETVHAALGEPTFTRGNEEFFLSQYGMGKVTFHGGLAARADMSWKVWYKPKAEVQRQFFPWAALWGVLGLFFVYKLIRAATLRVVVDDDGVLYAGKRIPFDHIVSLRDYNPKGWIDLYHKAGDDEKKIRLDDEKIAKFDEIVDAICQKKGFKNEVVEYQREQGAEADDTDDAADNDTTEAASDEK